MDTPEQFLEHICGILPPYSYTVLLSVQQYIPSVHGTIVHADEGLRHDLVNRIIDNMVCRCKEYYNRDKLHIAVYSLVWTAKLGTLPCRVINTVLSYYDEQQRPPECQTLSDILSEYNIEMRVMSCHTLEDILSPDTQGCYNCAMCQTTISNEQLVVRLVPCGHIYHSTPSTCLGSNQPTVSTWVRQHGRCPMCRAEVSLDFGTPTSYTSVHSPPVPSHQ